MRNTDLDALMTHYSDQEEAALYARFPLLAQTLEHRFTVTPDPDGVTFWLRDGTGMARDEPYGGQSAADEARSALILHQLMAAAARADARE